MTDKKEDLKYTINYGLDKFNAHKANIKMPLKIVVRQHDLEWHVKALEKAGAHDITSSVFTQEGIVVSPMFFNIEFKATDKEYNAYVKSVCN